MAGGKHFHSLNHRRIQTFYNLVGFHIFREHHIEIFTGAADADTERRSKRQQHVRAEALGISDRKFRTADCFLEVTHHIQMTHKFHHTCFGKLNSDFHSRHLLRMILLRSRNTASYSSG